MKDKEYYLSFAKDTLFDSYSKLAIVNLMTGEFEFVKMDPGFYDVNYDGLPDIFSYIKKQESEGIVISEYGHDYLKYSDPEYARKRIFSGDKRTVYSYKRRFKDGYKWVTFNVVAPNGCSPENPYALFCWREADTNTTIMVDALTTLSSMYYKILKINITTDSFEVIKTNEDTSCLPETISGWFRQFEEVGNIFEDDVCAFHDFTDIDSLRERFKKDGSMYSCIYRRLKGDIYRWAQLDLVPSIEYTNDSQVLLLYVKDIHEQHIRELRTRAEMYELYNRDALTLLYNRHKYNDDINELDKEGFEHIACAYIDVNGLHEMNNLLGHQSGDDMLCAVADSLRNSFPDEMVYRIGGDEFVVICKKHSGRGTFRLIQEARRELVKDNYEIAVGISEGSSDQSIHRILGSAELKMREDKAKYYEREGDKRTKRGLNEQLEKILTEKKDEEYLIKLLEKRFEGVYFVDMEHDTVRHIYMPKYFFELLQSSDYYYSPALKLYAKTYVMPDYAYFFEYATDYKWLKQKLLESGSVKFKFQKVDGVWMNLNILYQDANPIGRSESVWIFSSDSTFLNGM